MTDPVYCYPPDYTVLRNKLDIRDAADLARAERLFVVQRAAERIPDGDFDLEHLRAVHRHLFQDVYDWAGEVRTVEISKDGRQFQFRRYIETGMADVHRRIVQDRYFAGSSREEFARRAGAIMGDVNFVHPFREGNGRVQLQYLKMLAERAGIRFDLTRIERDAWNDASRRSHDGDTRLLSELIGRAMLPSS